jgi:hypothetical protein
MRKIIVVLIIMVLVASAGAYYYIYQPFSKQAAPEAVLPGDTLAMVRVCDLKGQIERFQSSRMGEALAGIDWPNLLVALGMPEDHRVKFVQALDNLGAGVDSLWFDVLFGQDILWSVLNSDIDTARLEAGDMTPLFDSLVVVSRPTQPTKVLESLGSMFGARLSVETEAYEQWEINRVPLEGGQPLYYALTVGIMIAGFSSEPVKACLRQSLDEATSLLKADRFRRHCGDLFESGRTDMMAFVDMEGVRDVVLEMADTAAGTDADAAHLKIQFENMRGMESLNLVRYNDGGPLVSSRMIVGLDRENMSSYLSQMLAMAPGENPTLEYAPADVLLYSWQNTFDADLYWENMLSDPGMTPEELAEIEQSFAANTGMAMEDLLSAFGSQVGFLVKDINMAGMFPVPEIALFVEVTKPEVVETLIGQLVGQSGMMMQSESYEDIDIHYVTLPIGGSLSPAYAYSDGLFTLAVNRPLLKSMLDAPDAGQLETQPHFKAFGSDMTADNNSVFYMRAEGLVERTREVLAWAMSWMAMMQPAKAESMQGIVSLGVDPLLDGLSMIQAVGARAYVEEDRICSDIQLLVDRSQ